MIEKERVREREIDRRRECGNHGLGTYGIICALLVYIRGINRIESPVDYAESPIPHVSDELAE